MTRLKTKKGATVNKIDMSLDGIIKLQKLENREKLRARRGQLQQRRRSRLNAVLGKTKLISSQSNRGILQHNPKSGSKKTQRKAQPGYVRTENQNGKLTFLKPKQKDNNRTVERRNNTKQRYSNKARENLKDLRQQMQVKQNVNDKRQKSNTKRQRSRNSRENLVNSRRHMMVKTSSVIKKSRGGIRQRRSFEERLHQAEENASKLKVVVDNPMADPSFNDSSNSRDLILKQLKNISAVTGNKSFTRLQQSRLQELRHSYSQLTSQSNPTKVYPLRISVNNDLAQVTPITSRSSPFNLANRIDIPIDTGRIMLLGDLGTLRSGDLVTIKYKTQSHIVTVVAERHYTPEKRLLVREGLNQERYGQATPTLNERFSLIPFVSYGCDTFNVQRYDAPIVID